MFSGSGFFGSVGDAVSDIDWGDTAETVGDVAGDVQDVTGEIGGILDSPGGRLPAGTPGIRRPPQGGSRTGGFRGDGSTGGSTGGTGGGTRGASGGPFADIGGTPVVLAALAGIYIVTQA